MPGRRRVSVFLELLIASYNKDAAQAAAATRRVSAEMEKLGDEADEVSRDMGQLAAATNVAKRQVDDLGDEALGTAASMSILDARLDSTRRSVHALALEFARTGDAMAGVTLDRQRTLLRRLERVRRDILLEPSRGGFANIGDLLAKVPTRATAIGGVVAAVAGPGPISPFLGAGAAGLGAGLIGTAGVAGGLLMASKDAKVIAAAKALGASISAEFFRGGDAFIKPALQAMTILDQAFKDMKLPETFAKMAPFVTTIADAFGDMGKNIMPGLNAAFERMGPFADAAHEGLSELGEALGTFLDDITASKGAVMGLEAAFKLLSAAIILTGRFLRMLADVFARMVSIFNAIPLLHNIPIIGEQLQDLLTTSSEAPGAIDPFAGSLDDLSTAAKKNAEQLKEMDDALQDLLSTAGELIPAYFSMEDLQDRAADAAADLTEQLKKQRKEGVAGAGTLVGNTQAARDNRDAVRDLTDLYGDMIIRTAEAGGNVDALKESLRTQLVQMGFLPAEVDRYVDALDLIPAEKITKLAVENHEALLTIQETERELNRLLRDRTVDVVATFRAGERASSYVPPGPANPAIPGSYEREGRRQSGGDVFAGVPYVVNERGYETVTFPASGTVHPASLTPMGWDGANVNVTVLLDGQAIEPRMVRVLTERERETKRQVQGRYRRSSIEERS